MFFTKENEERRSQLWRITVVTASVIILLVVSYFLHKMFTQNPIVGSWTSQTRDITINIKDDGEIGIIGGDYYVEGSVSYQVDRDSKTISFTLSQGNIIESSDFDQEEYTFISTYTYSIEQDILILTDMEFGNVESFIKE